MGQARIVNRTTVAGVTLESVSIREQELEQSFQYTMPAGIDGTLTTRTSDTAGVFTVASGHGVTTSNKISVFWEGGACYNCTVSATGATTITINAATGDVLPSVSTAIVIGVESTHTFAFDGDFLKVLAVACPNRSMARFMDASSIELAYVMQASEGRLWVSDQSVTNPLVGDSVSQIVIANGNITEAALSIGVLQSTN
jgi:hypothetical protein